MDASFDDREELPRAVWPPDRRPDFWVNGRLSSAALKDKRGLSVDRTFNRSLDDAVAFMRTRLQGRIVVLPVSLCLSVQACLWYRPSAGNAYHSEIHGSETEIELSDVQALLLARAAELVFEPDPSYQV